MARSDPSPRNLTGSLVHAPHKQSRRTAKGSHRPPGKERALAFDPISTAAWALIPILLLTQLFLLISMDIS